MKKLVGILILGILAVFFTASMASATPFDDTTYYWGHFNGSSLGEWGTSGWVSGNSNENNQDVIGDPEIGTGSGGVDNLPDLNAGKVTIDAGGNLTGVEIYYSTWNSLVTAGDLFIDIGADFNWDYVLAPVSNITDGLVYEVTGSFSAKKGFNDDYYLMSDNFFNASGLPSGDIRNDHPVKANLDPNVNAPLTLLPSPFTFYDFNSSKSPVQFLDFSIALGGNPFIIGFGPTCANDVLYETINPVPEPATMLLLGTGLIGLAGIGRKKLGRKKR